MVGGIFNSTIHRISSYIFMEGEDIGCGGATSSAFHLNFHRGQSKKAKKKQVEVSEIVDNHLFHNIFHSNMLSTRNEAGVKMGGLPFKS